MASFISSTNSVVIRIIVPDTKNQKQMEKVALEGRGYHVAVENVAAEYGTEMN